MHKWSPYPFVRFTIVLISGILIGGLYQNTESEKLSLLVLPMYFMYILIGRMLKRNTFTRFRTLIGLLGLTSIFLTGLFRSVVIHESNREEMIQADIWSSHWYNLPLIMDRSTAIISAAFWCQFPE